jgi:hypothetical protein
MAGHTSPKGASAIIGNLRTLLPGEGPEYHMIGTDQQSQHDRSPALAHTAARPVIVVMMGVSGSGKSTVAALLAAALGYQFEEGDDLHQLKVRHEIVGSQRPVATSPQNIR